MKSRLRHYAVGFRLFVAFMVGRVPIHNVRLFAYRHLLQMAIGQNTSFHWRAGFYAPEKIRIGSNSIIGNDAFLDGRREITIGDNVNIGGHVQIYTLEHDPQAADFGTKGGPVTIGDNAYVATRSTILPGVAIGAGAVVAAGAVVTKDVPEFHIVAGIPARKIGERSRELEYQLDYHLPFQ
jgi:acetyltransferase-like isoleucine patch superfamily enzyme